MPTSREQFLTRYGPWALVTGASSGIGQAIAQELAMRGFNQVLVGRSGDRLAVVADSVGRAGPAEIVTVQADISSQAGLQAVLEALSGREIGLYVGSAGFGTAGRFTDTSPEDELNMIDVNCRALAALAHPVLSEMRARGRGGAILMSSIVAFQGVAFSANYAATKAYVQTLAEGLAAEMRRYDVDVLASAPGPVSTGFAARADMRFDAAASPKEVAQETLAALGRKRTVRPGFRSKALGYGLGTLPRGLRSRILGSVMAGMTRHRHG